MREPILKKVAMPPTLFWAPMYVAFVNFVVQGAIMFVLMGVLGGEYNPLSSLITIIIGHVIIIMYGVKEPHMSKILQSRGPFLMPTKNVYRSWGHKLAS